MKATSHTPFSMASITKPFTTATLMTLVSDGKLYLDEPANRYLPRSKLTGRNGDPNKATVRMLGGHVSGLPDMFETFDAAEAHLIPTPEALLKAYGRIAYPPGTCYEYSNIGYAALNAIASALTHSEFGVLMPERVLAPLGLHDSFFGSDASRASSGATRYDPLGHPIPHYVTSTPASSELYASAHDVALFLLFNMRSQPGERVLSTQQIDELHRPIFIGPSGVATTFGWFTGYTQSGVPYFFKTGGDPGVANRVCFIPSQGSGCVAATNQSSAADLAYGVCDEVMTSFLPDWQTPEEYCGFPSIPLRMTPALRGPWEGLLENDGAHRELKLTVESNEKATMALGSHIAEAVVALRSEGRALTGLSRGRIHSKDTLRTAATNLQIKLRPYKDRLVGRLFAVAGDPNLKNVRLPYVASLHRT